MSTKDKATPPPEDEPATKATDAEFTEETGESAEENTPRAFTDPLDSGDVPALNIMPPNIVLLAIIGGLVLNWIVPISFGHTWGGIGLLLLGLSLGCIIWCKKIFDEAGTNVRPDRPSLALVEDGPYQYSRNPIYVCFLLGYAGLAMLADAPIMLLCLLPLWYVLDRYVIQPEEEYLAEKFGGAYVEYTSRVARWVGVRAS